MVKCKPPSTTRTCPVTSGDSKKNTIEVSPTEWTHSLGPFSQLRLQLISDPFAAFSKKQISKEQFISVTQSCPTLCDPMNCSTPGLPVHHQLPEVTETHIHWVCDAIQPSHPLSSPSPPAFNLSQHQGLFKWVSSSNQVAKVLQNANKKYSS